MAHFEVVQMGQPMIVYAASYPCLGAEFRTDESGRLASAPVIIKQHLQGLLQDMKERLVPRKGHPPAKSAAFCTYVSRCHTGRPR